MVALFALGVIFLAMFLRLIYKIGMGYLHE